LIGLPVTDFKLKAAPPRVAVQFGQDRPGDVQRLVEMGGDIDRLLARRRVKHKEDFLRLDQVAQQDQFAHQRLVDLQAAGGIKDQRIAIVLSREIERLAGNFQDVRLPFADENRQIQLFAEGFQLVHSGRAIDVGGHEQRRAGLFVEQTREFAAGSRFARSMQTDHHNATGIAAESQRGIGGTEKVDQFIVDDLDDLLTGLNALDDLLAEGLDFDLLDKIPGDLEIDIRVQERHADIAEGIRYIGLRDFAQSAEVAEGVLQFLAQGIEHGSILKRGGETSNFKLERWESFWLNRRSSVERKRQETR
jgi:hypothetical protein